MPFVFQKKNVFQVIKNMNDLTKQIYAAMSSQKGAEKLNFPPPFVHTLEMEYLAYEQGKSATVSFPIKESYNNPMGVTFGGYFSMFFDAAFGPFSSLTTKGPTTSLDLNVTFLKSLRPKDEKVIVEVEVVSLTKSYLILHGRAYKAGRVLVATATSRMLIMRMVS